jgi:uncharacterized protein YjaG (DUF416 family)
MAEVEKAKMQIHTYDEPALIAKLSRLPRKLMVLPALLAATRLLPNYVRFHAKTGRGDEAAVLDLHAALWRELAGNGAMSEAELRDAATRAEGLVPSEEDDWDEETQAYAEDAAAALTYACTALADNDAQNAAYALRRAYDSTDFLAQRTDGLPEERSAREHALLTHPVVQAELGRQARDLDDVEALAAGVPTDEELDALLQRAVREAEGMFPAAESA